MKDVLLTSKDLCKSFANNGGQNHVLDNVNLAIYKNDFTIIMGASGSGKSTLLYCLSGMDGITSGEVYYGEQVISSFREKEMAKLRSKEFGFVFQQMHLVSNLTLLENIIVPGFLDKQKSSLQVRERGIMLLETVNALEAKDRLPSQVSGGEAQRAAIARAMISEPKLLFADEPTGALNRKNTDDVLNLLSKLNGQGQSILMVTHDVRAAIRANRLLYLEDGRIVGEMTLQTFTEEEAKTRETQVNAWLTSMEW
jgi:putative ABC transport system ATP-binding protein